MKTLLYTSFLLGLSACTKDHQSPAIDRELVVVRDRTDSMTRPTTADIIAYTDLDRDIWQGIKITITDISDVGVTGTKTFTLEQENPFLGNKKIRQCIIARFYNELDSFLSIKDSVQSLQHSVVFRKVAEVLNRLSVSPAPYKAVLIYSDCMENSSVSFYAPTMLESVQTNPEPIRQQLEQETPLHDLSGIHVYFRFTPKDFNTDTVYQIARKFFMDTCVKHGATVENPGS